MAHNKKEAKATGGGPNNVLPISTIEDTIAKITGIYTVVDGVQGTSFGTTDADVVQVVEAPANEESVASAGQEPEPPSPPSPPPPSQQRKINKSLESYMEEQKSALGSIADVCRKSLEATQEANYNGKRMYRAIEKLHDVLIRKAEEDRRHHLEMEKLAAEKNEIKRRRLEIEQMKFDIETNNK